MRIVVYSILLLTLVPALSLAETGGTSHAPAVSDLAFPALNFVVYILLLYWLLKKPLSTALGSRRAGIHSAVLSAKTKLERSQRELREANVRISGLPSEIALLERRDAEESKREAQAIREAAVSKSQRIALQAKASAAAEEKSIEEGLKRELAVKVVELAASRLEREINEQADRALRERALQGISGLR